MTIVEFLTARLDEEEQAAAAASLMSSRDWLVSAEAPARFAVTDDDQCTVATDEDGGIEQALAEFIAYNDPARALADAAAKRRIIAACDYDGMTAEYVLQCLAQPYDWHPDFDPSWGQQ